MLLEGHGAGFVVKFVHEVLAVLFDEHLDQGGHVLPGHVGHFVKVSHAQNAENLGSL